MAKDHMVALVRSDGKGEEKGWRAGGVDGDRKDLPV